MRRLRRRHAFLAAALLALLAVSLLAVALTRSGREIVEPFAVNQPGPIDANNSPSIARNPADPDNVVIAHRVDRPIFDSFIHASHDGGRSWVTHRPPLPAGTDAPFAPDLAFGEDGTMYALYSNLAGPGNVPERLWLATSPDGGRTFSEPREVAGELTFQPRLAVGDGTIHISWLQGEALGLLRFEEPLPDLVMITSSDGGESFSDPVTINAASRERIGAGVPTVLDDDSVLVTYVDFGNDTVDYSGEAGPPHDQPFSLVAAQADAGASRFDELATIDDGLLPTRRFLVFLPEFPSVATVGDTVHVTWADGRNGDLDVFVATSRDRGRSWTDPVRVNDNRLGDGTSQYLPAIDVGADGRIDIAFLDRRHDAGDVFTGVTLATATEAGAGFRNVDLSNILFDSGVGPSAAPFLEPDFGTRLGVSIGEGETMVAWTDTRLGSDATGRQDIFATVVSHAGAARGPWLIGGGIALALSAVALGLGVRRRD